MSKSEYEKKRDSSTYLCYYENSKELKSILEMINKMMFFPNLRYFLVSDFKQVLAVLENLANTRNILDELKEFEDDILQKIKRVKFSA